MIKLSRDRVQVPAAMLLLGTGLAAAVLVGQYYSCCFSVSDRAGAQRGA